MLLTQPKIMAFHAYKGGVGQTTYLLIEAERAVKKGQKVLVVDAGLQSPSIIQNTVSVSFASFLEAIHYPPTGNEEDSILFFSKEIKTLSLPRGGQVFFLPAVSELAQCEGISVWPHHLASNPRNPLALIDCIHRLGAALEVDLILIDTQPGITDVSAPFLFDDHIDHIFVGTEKTNSGLEYIRSRLKQRGIKVVLF